MPCDSVTLEGNPLDQISITKQSSLTEQKDGNFELACNSHVTNSSDRRIYYRIETMIDIGDTGSFDDSIQEESNVGGGTSSVVTEWFVLDGLEGEVNIRYCAKIIAASETKDGL